MTTNKDSILFWVAILSFFGIKGLDLLNGVINFVNQLYLNLGGWGFLLLIIVIVIITQKKKK